MGCGGAAAATAPAPSCAREEAAVADARAALEGCRGEGGDVSEDEVAYTELAARLEAHEASLGTTVTATEPVVSDEAAMAVADQFWSYLDRVASRFTDHGPIDRAEDAAEALMRDRSGEGAIQAAHGAREALDALHALVAPDAAAAPEPCAEEAEMLRESLADLEGSCPGAAHEGDAPRGAR